MKNSEILKNPVLLALLIVFLGYLTQITQAQTNIERTLKTEESWDLGNGYFLTAQSIDSKATPKQVWLWLLRNGTRIDDIVVAEGDIYNYGNIFSGRITHIYAEDEIEKVQIEDVHFSPNEESPESKSAEMTPAPTRKASGFEVIFLAASFVISYLLLRVKR